jgi:hypothetical protein
MRVDEYHARADECEEIGKQFHGAKKLYENLASQWRELAKQAESRERTNETA